jgi:uncharacterized protein YjdB
MPYILSSANRIARRLTWLALMPALSVCSADTSTGTTIDPPATVSDLSVVAMTDASVTLSFTQVDDGLGQPANYDLRYSAAPMSWGSAASTANGTCSTPISGTAIGGNLSCTVLGLSPATTYDFQLIAFRGTLNSDAVFGGRSNLVVASTASIPPPTPVVTSVTVTPPSASIAVGATTTLTATVKDQQGNVMTGQSMSWSSSTAAATVSTNGVVTGVAGGSATVTAASSGVSGTATITVIAAPPPTPVVTTVTVAPSSSSIAVGATVALTATVKDQLGNVMAGQMVTWTSNSSNATVSSSGVVTGIAAGSATITATTSGKTGTSAITVTAPPPPPPTPVVTTVTVAPTSASIAVAATVALTATVRDQQGSVMTGQTVTWSSNSANATVSSSGVVTGVSAGSATITATSAGKTGTSNITVTAPPPPPPPGGTLLFQENFEDANLGSRGWYDNTGAVLSTAEHIAGSNSSAQYRFTQGAMTPTSGGAQRHKFTPSNSFYVSFYVKYSTNWVGSGQAYHPHEFYVLSSLDGDYDGPSQNVLDVYIEHSYQNGGRPRLAIQDNKSVNYTNGALPNNLVAITESRSTSGCNGVVESNFPNECYNAGSYWYNSKTLTGPVTFQPNPGAGYKNNWNFVEAYFQLNTIVNGIGQANGVMQYWFNGTLIIDRNDVLFRTGARPTLQFSQFLIAPYIGDGSPVDQSMWVDNLRVATGRIP